MKITGIVTTLNEARNIEDCVRSLQRVCDEVVVTDSYSTDNTVELAQKAGAKVFLHEYIGDGLQKNLALPNASNDWVLSIDADERLSDELVAAIQQIDFEHTPWDGFALRRRNLVGDRWIKCCRWYPDYLVRLFNKRKLQFAELKQHAYVPTQNTQELKADLIHYRYRNYDELFAKPERNYSTRGAKILFLKGKKANAFSPFFHGCAAFFVNYFIRGGILGGVDGYVLSKSIAHNSFLKYAKLLEYQRDPSVRDREDWSSVW
ncbi:MAG: glycosyltransferase family 2 protein [Bacteroidales bacterium]|nr:glycosyltransferase family 2 protein [Bacteroidales bacterium]